MLEKVDFVEKNAYSKKKLSFFGKKTVVILLRRNKEIENN